MKELSVFIDESGDAGPISKHYLVSLVLHEQDDSIDGVVGHYRRMLVDRRLSVAPFHFGPLLTGHDDYKWQDLYSRKQQLVAFANMCQRLPFRYACCSYEKKGALASAKGLSERISADITQLLDANLEYFQSFDRVKIYYDGGQSVVTNAIHSAIEGRLSRQAAFFRDASPRRYVLSQVADYVCGIELTGLKFEKGEQTRTDLEFFSNVRAFKKNYLKKLRRKRL